MTTLSFERFRLARDLFDRRRYREAITQLEALLDEGDFGHGDAEVRELLTRSYFHAAYLPKAERLARETISTDPTNAYAHTLLVRTLQRMSRHDEADKAAVLARAVGADLGQ